MSIYVGEARTISTSDMQGPCPDGFHVPLNSEWQSVKSIWIALGGGSSDGYGFRGVLKLPPAGFLYAYDGGKRYDGNGCYYWSSQATSITSSYDFCFGSSNINAPSSSYNSYGYKVRPFKNSPVIPTSSWTKLYGTSIEAGGIFWSSTDGLISLSSDGQTWITISDKNIGATIVWNQGDERSQDNCGYFYQWGNNYGFAHAGASSKQTGQIDTTGYGPGNYFSNGVFVYRSSKPRGWLSVQNDNLRGGVSQGTSTTTSGIKNLYIGDNEAKEVYVGSKKIRPIEPITTSGIYHNAKLGLISISGDGINWTTIADKNLGATTVYNSGDTLSESNCGKYFQRGNNYGFSRSGDITVSSSTVNASTYGPGNYYNSNVFIKGSDPSNWDSSNNTNLWGNTTNTNEARRGPCPEGYHIMSQSEWSNLYTLLTSTLSLAATGVTLKTYLLMPYNGRRPGTSGATSGQGSDLWLWTSSPVPGIATNAYDIVAGDGGIYQAPTRNNGKTYGIGIRPFKNEAVQPDTLWTKLL